MNTAIKSTIKGILIILVFSAVIGFFSRNLLPQVNLCAGNFFLVPFLNFNSPIIGAFGFVLLFSGIAGVSGISLRTFISLARFGHADPNDVNGLVITGINVGLGFFISFWYVISFANTFKLP